MVSTGEVAWYGAIVATLTFAFSVLKWLREAARIRVRIVRTFYEDGGFSKIEKTEHGEAKTPIIYFHIEVINVGERPTTIMGVAATSRETLADKISRSKPFYGGEVGYSGGAFTPHHNNRLPYVLAPGEIWSCRLPVDHIEKFRENGWRMKLELTTSHKTKPLLIPFPTPKPSNAAPQA